MQDGRITAPFVEIEIHVGNGKGYICTNKRKDKNEESHRGVLDVCVK